MTLAMDEVSMAALAPTSQHSSESCFPKVRSIAKWFGAAALGTAVVASQASSILDGALKASIFLTSVGAFNAGLAILRCLTKHDPGQLCGAKYFTAQWAGTAAIAAAVIKLT